MKKVKPTLAWAMVHKKEKRLHAVFVGWTREDVKAYSYAAYKVVRVQITEVKGRALCPTKG